MAATFEIQLRTPAGLPIRPLDKIVECIYARAENDTGEMTLVLPDDIYAPSLFRPYSQILIQRSLPNKPPYIDLQTPWFVIEGPYADLAPDGKRLMVVECIDALGLILNGANVAYQQYSDQAYKQGYATDLAKAIVRENRGSLATDTSRDISSWMSVDDDDQLGAFISAMSFDRLQVLDALQKIAQASAESATPIWMGFDILIDDPYTSHLIFRTYTGQRGLDHRLTGGGKILVLSATKGSLSAVRSGSSFRDSASYIYAGGASVGDLKPIETAENVILSGLSPFGRRERYVDTQAPDADALGQEAMAALRRFRPRRYMEAQAVEVVGAMRGVDWDYGDYVTAEDQAGNSFDVRISKIGVKLSAGPNGGLIEDSTVDMKSETYGYG